MYLELTRITDDGVQTLGQLKLWSDNDKLLATFDTLELTDNDNQRRISCIPDGQYIVKRKISMRFGRCFQIMNVPARDGILIHAGNFNHDTKGCILIGYGLKDINGDFHADVTNSNLAMKCLRTLLVKDCVLLIHSIF